MSHSKRTSNCTILHKYYLFLRSLFYVKSLILCFNLLIKLITIAVLNVCNIYFLRNYCIRGSDKGSYEFSSVRLSVCPSDCLSISLPIHFYICLFICLLHSYLKDWLIDFLWFFEWSKVSNKSDQAHFVRK